MRNPHVDIIGHPTGILLGEREAYDVDFEALLAVAQETGTVLEVNAMPNRLDLDDVHVRRAVERGVKLAISTDSHRPDGLATIVLGLGMARRGWAEARDVVNTMTLDRLLAHLK
jgi:DNA polymerase (family 10)